MRFIALLRGINVGGNSKVAMPKLKACLETAGLNNVITYINSGNVIFESDQADHSKLTMICEEAIEEEFGFHVSCLIIASDDLLMALRHTPRWWNQDKTSKHNALFVMTPTKEEEVVLEMGEVKPEYEMIFAYHPIIFWSAPIATFSRTRYSKIVGSKIYKKITIRNANTILKLAQMCS
jgi:uncharacterized protein (DUF1697 family)